MAITKEQLTSIFFPGTDDDEEDDEVEQTQNVKIRLDEQPAKAEPKTSSYEPESTTIKNVPSDAQMVLFEPRSFDEAQQIASYLKGKKACVVNLHRLQREFSQRTIDVLTGVVFALDGSIQKIGHNVILCTPKDVAVTGSISMESDDE